MTITSAHRSVRGWCLRSPHLYLLTNPQLGFVAAGEALARLADLTGPIEAAQGAVARYSRRGFEAAAVTGLAVGVGRMLPMPGPHRTATIRFAHPYAVVATVRGRGPNDPWDALPVFAAWITRPDDTRD